LISLRKVFPERSVVYNCIPPRLPLLNTIRRSSGDQDGDSELAMPVVT
jgi:hypothetical protein